MRISLLTVNEERFGGTLTRFVPGSAVWESVRGAQVVCDVSLLPDRPGPEMTVLLLLGDSEWPPRLLCLLDCCLLLRPLIM